MSLKNKVDVRIAGKDYTIMGVESEEYIQKIALYIDKKINEIMKANNKLSTSVAAILASINVTDDYFKLVENDKYSRDILRQAHGEIELFKMENTRLSNEILALNKKNTNLQLDLARKEAELNEVRNTLERATKLRLYATAK